jgi:hypothetical protein
VGVGVGVTGAGFVVSRDGGGALGGGALGCGAGCGAGWVAGGVGSGAGIGAGSVTSRGRFCGGVGGETTTGTSALREGASAVTGALGAGYGGSWVLADGYVVGGYGGGYAVPGTTAPPAGGIGTGAGRRSVPSPCGSVSSVVSTARIVGSWPASWVVSFPLPARARPSSPLEQASTAAPASGQIAQRMGPSECPRQ